MELEKYYRDLAHYYQFHLNAKISLSRDLLSSRIFLIGMVSELKLHGAKKGNSDKLLDRIKAYDKILDTLDECDRLESQNYTLVQMTNEAIRKSTVLEKRCKELEERISEIERFYENK